MCLTRDEIERSLAEEAELLSEVAALLNRAAPLEDWSATHRSAFALALCQPGLGTAEQWKATALKRHLFGPDATGDLPPLLLQSIPQEPTTRECRFAERLRADLTSRVRLRAGRYLNQG
ncbi:MAG: hypothetical protein JW797_09930 [Bradymonadales bacterium]|nr:hypothetical protein [Bradymonadales bacterium]